MAAPFMIFAWLRGRRRRKLLSRPFPQEWLAFWQQNFAHYSFLSPDEQARLRDRARVFVAEKHWEGCGGLTMTDEIKATIAGMACLLVLGLDRIHYERVKSILVYPHEYHGHTEKAGIVHEDEPRVGEAWYRGPVILSWAEVAQEGRHPHWGRNTVFHEFAHQLDMLDGLVNGTPLLQNRQQYRRWQEIMTAEYQQLLKESVEGRATLLDQYGTENEGEFFAVATECFFNRPKQIARRHPLLYDILREYYRQDPARTWLI